MDMALTRLSTGKTNASDPGYQTVSPDAPDLDTIVAFFRQEIRRWQVATAKKALES